MSICHPHKKDGLLKGDFTNFKEGESVFHKSPQTYLKNRPTVCYSYFEEENNEGKRKEYKADKLISLQN